MSKHKAKTLTYHVQMELSAFFAEVWAKLKLHTPDATYTSKSSPVIFSESIAAYNIQTSLKSILFH